MRTEGTKMKTKFTYLVGATYLIEVGSFRFLSDPGFDPGEPRRARDRATS